jgi:hypothetical protein
MVLCAGNNDAGERGALDPRAHFCRAVLKTPGERGVEIVSGLDPRRGSVALAATTGRVWNSLKCGVKP